MANIPYRSKLLPHWETIKRLRGERQTWAEIAQYLTEKCDCPTTLQAVHIFYKRKTKGHVPLGFDGAEVAPQTPQASAPELAPHPEASAAATPPESPEPNTESIFDKPEKRTFKKPTYKTDF